MATIIGTNGNNILNGTVSSDTIIGRAGIDQLSGNGGNDRLNGGTQNDLLDGGWGIDTADYSNILIGGTTHIGATAGVIISLNLAGAQNTVGAGLDQLVSIENLTGTNFADTLTGNSANNVLTGLNGNDTLNGGNGNDLLNGGGGIDTASYSTATAGVNVGLDVGDGDSTEASGHDTLVDIESLTGSSFNDTFYAKWLWDGTFRGEAGHDTLTIERGHDFTLDGGSGNDTLNGWEGYGTLNGGAGNDQLHVIVGDYTLNGGTGNDTLVAEFSSATLNGGAGADTLIHTPNPFVQDENPVTFEYTSVNDTPSGSGRDTITGFTGKGAGVGDKIDLTDIDANALVSGNQAFTYIGNAPFTAAGQLRYNTTSGILSGSTDADAASEFQILLIGIPTLTVGGAGSDILL